MRNIQYRAWGVDIEMMHDWESVQKIDGWWKHDALALMQSTGLKDKNDVLIYEGDIVRYYDSTTMYLEAQVKWIHCGWSIQSEGMDGDDIELGNFELPNRSIEIIGNIYENPELLT